MCRKLFAHSPWFSSLVVLLATFCIAGPSRGQDAGLDAPYDAEGDSATTEALPTEPRTDQIRALIGGLLDVSVEPQSLFDVPLDDEAAVEIEGVRLRALLRTVAESAQTALTRPTLSKPAASTRVDIETLDAARWESRVELDRARLEFYSLARERRQELVRSHAARREAARPPETEQERRAREAEAERRQALEAAQAARSEAERLVGEEVARIIGVEQSVTAVRERLRGLREELVARRDIVLGWQRRVRDAKASSPADADATYDALRRALRTSRAELATSLDQLESSASEVPDLGPDPLREIPQDVPTDQASKRRGTLDRLIRDTRAEERSLREERASILLDETGSFNRERLGLLRNLSVAKRAAVTGFTEAGFDQARSEARHLLLILRYHHHVGIGWIRSLRHRESLGVGSLWRVMVAVPWIFVALAFEWWRRRSHALLALADERMMEADRADRRTFPSPQRRTLGFLIGVHRPLEWLLFFGASVWLLPTEARGLLEVQLLTVMVGWTLVGAFIVNAINVLATSADASEIRVADGVGRLRLRSLRLVGRIVVVFILIFVLSERLVGKGTVYSWVMSTCWFAAVPVFLVLVLWWRDTVFERVERVRRKSRLQAWVLANRTGWKSFIAAMTAAVQLFALGSIKTARNWLSTFDVARRVHAYLYKRELDRLIDGKAATEYRPLDAGARALLAPDRASDTWVTCPADEHLDLLRKEVSERQGGVVAVVGARGMGKSSLLRRLTMNIPNAITLSCSANTSFATIRDALEDRTRSGGEVEQSICAPELVLLDDAHAFVRPVLHGLRPFDEVLAYARAQSSKTLWIFAIDGVVWPFLRRARDARPLFDRAIVLESWTDEQIGNLLSLRSAEAQLTPTFEDLLDKLPPSADEIDEQEALNAKRTGYFRMVWDYARGNPAIALQAWRSSLVAGIDGSCRVRPLQAPNATRLEMLPDSALFILRAVLQMTPATLSDVVEATRLTEAQVQNVFHFGQAHGYLVEDGGRVQVAWEWLRSVTLFLERRHLLVNS